MPDYPPTTVVTGTLSGVGNALGKVFVCLGDAIVAAAATSSPPTRPPTPVSSGSTPTPGASSTVASDSLSGMTISLQLDKGNDTPASAIPVPAAASGATAPLAAEPAKPVKAKPTPWQKLCDSILALRIAVTPLFGFVIGAVCGAAAWGAGSGFHAVTVPIAVLVFLLVELSLQGPLLTPGN